MKILLINYASVLVAIYVLLESLDPLRSMDASMRCFCHKMKYLAALATSGWVVYSGICLELNIYFLMMIGTIALFVWPRTIWRFRTYLDNLDNFRGFYK